VKVSVHSALSIADARCVSHETRVNRTDHSAVVEYVAEEISPDRDFEVRVDLARKGSQAGSVQGPHGAEALAEIADLDRGRAGAPDGQRSSSLPFEPGASVSDSMNRTLGTSNVPAAIRRRASST